MTSQIGIHRTNTLLSFLIAEVAFLAAFFSSLTEPVAGVLAANYFQRSSCFPLKVGCPSSPRALSQGRTIVESLWRPAATRVSPWQADFGC